MFTGIVTDMGEVRSLEQAGDLTARIGTAYDTSGIELGASIACDGVCLTVVDLGTTSPMTSSVLGGRCRRTQTLRRSTSTS